MGQIKKTCLFCKKDFITYLSRIGNFCSNSCTAKYRQALSWVAPSRKGKTWEEIHGKEKAEQIRQKLIQTLTGETNPNYGNKKLVGENNPRWIDGRSYQVYPPEFSKRLKRMIFERDEFKCAICTTNRDITVHHKDHNRQNNTLENLITLCRSHNSKANFIDYGI